MHQLFIIWLSTIAPAQADRFIGDNTLGQVKFDVGSTLHNVPGDITRFTTELNLGEQVSGNIVMQSESIKTGINVRDQRMYTYCLDTEQYPTISFEIRSVTGDVDGFTSNAGTGDVNLHGTLSIRSTQRDVVVPATYNWTDDGLRLDGGAKVNWSDFGVPDPSILISKVQPVIDLNFELKMKKSI